MKRRHHSVPQQGSATALLLKPEKRLGVHARGFLPYVLCWRGPVLLAQSGRSLGAQSKCFVSTLPAPRHAFSASQENPENEETHGRESNAYEGGGESEKEMFGLDR